MSNTALLRLATAADADAICTLVRAAYAKWVPVIGLEPRPMLADYAQALLAHRFDLIEAGDTLLGLIETEDRADHLWVENVAVHPHHQGRGLGRCLLARAEQLAQDAGHTQMRLLTNAAFAANIALYGRLGYATTHTEPFGNGTTVYMTKHLTPDGRAR